MKVKLIQFGSDKASEISLNKDVFGLPVRQDILQRVVEWQRAKKRSGTHATRTIDMISGTTKKPFRQKGTGNARQGSLRSPHMRGGAVMHGPKPHSHAYSLNKKVRALGLKTALSSKLADGKLLALDAATLAEPKSKLLSAELKKHGLTSVLFIGGKEIENNFKNAAKNLKHVHVLPEQGANVYDILRYDTLVITKDAIQHFEERFVKE